MIESKLGISRSNRSRVASRCRCIEEVISSSAQIKLPAVPPAPSLAGDGLPERMRSACLRPPRAGRGRRPGSGRRSSPNQGWPTSSSPVPLPGDRAGERRRRARSALAHGSGPAPGGRAGESPGVRSKPARCLRVGLQRRPPAVASHPPARRRRASRAERRERRDRATGHARDPTRPPLRGGSGSGQRRRASRRRRGGPECRTSAAPAPPAPPDPSRRSTDAGDRADAGGRAGPRPRPRRVPATATGQRTRSRSAVQRRRRRSQVPASRPAGTQPAAEAPAPPGERQRQRQPRARRSSGRRAGRAGHLDSPPWPRRCSRST